MSQKKYSDVDLVLAVQQNCSIAGVLRQLCIRPSGGSHSHISRRIKQMKLDTLHFLGARTNRGVEHKGGPQKRMASDILILRESGKREKTVLLNRALIEIGRVYVCAHCGNPPLWNGKPLVLQIEHINRNWLDSRQENLLFLCPNCHTQTKGWCGRKTD